MQSIEQFSHNACSVYFRLLFVIEGVVFPYMLQPFTFVRGNAQPPIQFCTNDPGFEQQSAQIHEGFTARINRATCINVALWR